MREPFFSASPFHRGLAAVRLTNPYCEAIDPPAYFPDIMDHIVPPTQLLAQIITNQYTFRAAHQNIILTHDLFPQELQSLPSSVVNGGLFCDSDF